MTYQEKEYGTVTDWSKELSTKNLDDRLHQSIKIGYSPRDYKGSLQELEAIATSWVTCAVGTLDESILRDPLGSPLDQPLLKLGVAFGKAVRNMVMVLLDDNSSQDKRKAYIGYCRELYKFTKDREYILLNPIRTGQPVPTQPEIL